jgi:hypothetical protein
VVRTHCSAYSFSIAQGFYSKGSHHSYLIVDNVVFLTIADKSYPRKLAFSYLDELSKEFTNTYGPKVEIVRKPYAFVGFGLQTTLKRMIHDAHLRTDRHLYVENGEAIS